MSLADCKRDIPPHRMVNCCLSPLKFFSPELMRKIINRFIFQQIHRRTIIYNDAREDPRIDRIALELTDDDVVFVITSAGCNVLDYALTGVKRIYSIDINPLQNALLELKLAAIRRLDFDDFFQFFGEGAHPNALAIYRDSLSDELSETARKFWDKKIRLFDGRRKGRSFYFSGPCGRFAQLIGFYIKYVARVKQHFEAMFDSKELEEQVQIYDQKVKRRFWNKSIRWLIGRDMTMALFGVPLVQRKQVERDFPGGISGFAESCLTAVFTELPLHDNYFWRVYLYGKYSRDCCPEYLKFENFQRLKAGLIDRIEINTMSVADFLNQDGLAISKFVLLDHLDWLAGGDSIELTREWQGIVDRATSRARLIWRSGGLVADYNYPIEVMSNGEKRTVGELLNFNKELAKRLHQQDRVHTYGSFEIAQFK